MKRFHAHITVDRFAASIAFYNQLFGQQATIQEADYAKWMLEDPPVNFAISSRGHTTGLNHFGFQVDSATELDALKCLAQSTGSEHILEQLDTTCCYANSNKHWLVDPQGIAWEHFHTMSKAQKFCNNQMGARTVPNTHTACAPVSTQSTCCQ